MAGPYSSCAPTLTAADAGHPTGRPTDRNPRSDLDPAFGGRSATGSGSVRLKWSEELMSRTERWACLAFWLSRLLRDAWS